MVYTQVPTCTPGVQISSGRDGVHTGTNMYTRVQIYDGREGVHTGTNMYTRVQISDGRDGVHTGTNFFTRVHFSGDRDGPTHRYQHVHTHPDSDSRYGALAM